MRGPEFLKDVPQSHLPMFVTNAASTDLISQFHVKMLESMYAIRVRVRVRVKIRRGLCGLVTRGCRWSEVSDHPWTEIKSYKCTFCGVKSEPLMCEDGVQARWPDGTPRAKFEAGYVKGLEEFAQIVESDILRHIKTHFAERMASPVAPNDVFATIEQQVS